MSEISPITGRPITDEMKERLRSAFAIVDAPIELLPVSLSLGAPVILIDPYSTRIGSCAATTEKPHGCDFTYETAAKNMPKRKRHEEVAAFRAWRDERLRQRKLTKANKKKNRR